MTRFLLARHAACAQSEHVLLGRGLDAALDERGTRRAHALAARLPGVDLLTIDKQGHAWRSQGFPALQA
jgi:thiamine biosynthesis lipoprotein